MSSMNISIRKEAYDFLKSRKVKDESFSDVVLAFKEPKKSPLDFWGAWADKPEGEVEAIKKELVRTRKEFNKSWTRRLK